MAKPAAAPRRKRKAATPEFQSECVERGQVLESTTNATLAQLYSSVNSLVQRALPYAYGVLGGSAALYLHGLAAVTLLPAGAATTLMQGAAFLFGAASGVIFARSSPVVRRITSGEGDTVQKDLEFRAITQRLRTALPLALRYRESISANLEQKLIDAAFNPSQLPVSLATPATALGKKVLQLGPGVGRGTYVSKPRASEKLTDQPPQPTP